MSATRLNRLVHRLDLQPDGDDIFLGGAGAGGVGAPERLYGGMVAAQATVAAARTVDTMSLHALHALFLRPGRPERPIRYRVTRSKSGRTFHARLVEALQDDALILQCQASFTRPVSGVRHQGPMTAAPDPDDAPNRDQLRGRENWRELPLDVRMCDPMTADEPLPPTQRLWLRANGTMPKDPVLHAALLVYASDRSLLDTAWRPHADRGRLAGASLDHGVWLHAAPRLDDWHLYTMESPAAGQGRGLAIGAIYRRDGERVATVTQEGVLRTDPR